MIADPVAPIFVGREAFLQTVRATVQRDRAVAITGPSGIGKTAVAREYLRRYGAEYQHVLWLNAATRELLLADCLDAMTRLNLAPYANLDFHPIQPFRDWLAEQSDYLLIIDDADDSSRIQSLLGSVQGGYVLQMSSPRVKEPPITCLPLEALNDEDGASLLLRSGGIIPPTAPVGYADVQQREAALALANVLDGVPLALELAGATIKLWQRAIPAYLATYRERDRSFPVDSRGQRLTQIVTIVSALASEALSQQYPQALVMLRNAAMLAHEMIPTDLILQVGETTQATGDAATTVASLDLLFAARLLTPASVAGTVQIHPLIQQAVHRQVSPLEDQHMPLRLLKTIHHQLPTYDALSPSERLRMIVHIRQILANSEQWSFTTSDVAEVCAWAAMIAAQHDNYRGAADLLNRALSIWRLSLADNDLIVITVAQRLATLYSQAGEYAQEEALWHQVIRARTSISGADQLELLRWLKNLGIAYMAQGKMTEAATTFRAAFTLGEQALGKEHPLTLEISFQLALLHLTEEQFAKAAALFTNVGALYEKTLGPENAETLAALQVLVPILMKLEQWDNAAAVLHKLLPRYERTQGPRSDPVMVCLAQLMQLDIVSNQGAHLATLFEQLVAIFEARLAEPDSPVTFSIMCSMASMYMETGRLDDAKLLWKRALALCERMPEFGAQAKTVALQGLISLYVKKGQFSLAIATISYASSLLDEWQALAEDEKTVLREAYQRSKAELRQYAHPGAPVSASQE